jgi:hypothetical protein
MQSLRHADTCVTFGLRVAADPMPIWCFEPQTCVDAFLRVDFTNEHLLHLAFLLLRANVGNMCSSLISIRQ